ncbi:hypothetical protein TNCV_2930891 [Trichonephila clavipes]|nr:hypothetical protein TNCV_2930891 [Trichonephila clavipes]
MGKVLNRFRSIATSLWPPPAKKSTPCACSEPWVQFRENFTKQKRKPSTAASVPNRQMNPNPVSFPTLFDFTESSALSSEVRVIGDRGKTVKKQGAHETAVTQQSAKRGEDGTPFPLPRPIHKRENRFPFPHEQGAVTDARLRMCGETRILWILLSLRLGYQT